MSGGPRKDNGGRISHCILRVRVWARSWDSSGLAKALTGAQGLVQQVLGDLCDTWHWDNPCDTTSSAGLGARGSRQTSGPRSSWIKLPNGGVSHKRPELFWHFPRRGQHCTGCLGHLPTALSCAAGTSQGLEEPEVLCRAWQVPSVVWGVDAHQCSQCRLCPLAPAPEQWPRPLLSRCHVVLPFPENKTKEP